MIKYLFLSVLLALPIFAESMQSDNAHKVKEDHMAALTYSEMLHLRHAEAVRWLITPKLRLTKEDIQALHKGSLVNVDGQRTSATLTFIEGDIPSSVNGPDLLMEKVLYDAKKNAYVVTYSYPKDNANHRNSIKVQLSDIKVKEADDDMGKYIVDLIAHPHAATQSVSPHQSTQAAYATNTAQSQMVVVSPPPTETVIIEERGRHYYYGPGYYGPRIVVGSSWGGPHHYGHHW